MSAAPNEEAAIVLEPKTEIPLESRLVDFEENDSLNPLTWSKSYRWFVVVLTALLSTIMCVYIA